MANNNSASSHGIKGQQVTADAGNLYTTNTKITQQNTETQLAARFGGSRKKQKGGLVVPPVKVSYVERGVGNTNTSNNVTNSARTTADLTAQSELDSQVAPVQKAGRSHKLIGGWPEWGCMSGGRKSRRSRSRSRRLKKSRRLRKKSCRRRKSK